jgi:hypothetical protein
MGVAVAGIAHRGRKQQGMASKRLGYLEGVQASAKVVTDGSSSPSALIEAVSAQIGQMMGLARCRFDYGPGLGYPRLERDGSLRWRNQIWDVDRNGLPADMETELVVESAGQFMGRFLLNAHPYARPSQEERQVAAVLAAQVGAALRAYHDTRSSA